MDTAKNNVMWGIEKIQVTKDHVDEALEKVREKPWAEKLGKVLEVSSTIVESVGGFVPGASVIGGALSFGATLLNGAEPSLKELKSDLNDIKKQLEDGLSNKVAERALPREKKEIEEKITNPVSEIRDDFEEV